MKNRRNESVLDTIIPVFVDPGRKDILDIAAHTRAGHLEIIFMRTDNIEGDVITSILTKDAMRQLGITPHDLFFKSLENAERIAPAEVLPMREALGGFAGSADDFPPEMDFYVVSNKKKRFGAASILQGSVARDFAREHGSFFVLPSSVHDVMIISNEAVDACFDSVDELADILRDTNKTLLPQDFLSDKLFHFDARSCEFKLVDTEAGEEERI